MKLSPRQREDEPAEIDAELRLIADNVQSTKWRAADLIIRMQEIEGWAPLGFKSKTLWLKSFKDSSRSALYEAVKHRKSLPGIEAAVLDSITQKNLKYFKLLPEAKREDPEVLEMAQGPEQEFVAYLNSIHGLHLTASRKLVVDFEDAGQYEDVSEVLKQYAADNAIQRDQALWEILQESGVLD